MADEIFRPQRKPITNDDLSIAPSENQAKLNQMAEIRKQAAEVNDSNFRDPSEGAHGFEVNGPMPPQLQQAIQQQRQMSQVPSKGRSRPELQDAPAMRMTGSNKLEELLSAIGEKTSVYEPVELPSKGKFYDGTDGPTNGIVHIRPMTGEEEEILATPRFVRKGQAINMIFRRCMQEKNFDPQSFVTPDRTYLLIYLRGISYTPDYDVEVRCTECEAKFATVIDLNSLYVDQCPPDFSLESLNGKLPTTGFSYTYRLSRGADEQEIQEHRDRKMKGFDTAGLADDTLIYRTAQLVESIEGLTNKHELMQLIKRLPINDVAHLRNSVNTPPFGVDTNIEINCPSCLADFTVDLPLESNFFFPKRKTPNQTQA
jgi:hypothetical protein